MFFGCSGLQKKILAEIVAHKKGVYTCKTTPDQAVTLLSRKPYKRLKACAEIIPACPGAVRAVWNDQREGRSQRRIIFYRHNAGARGLHRLPHPLVVEINIDGKKVDIAHKSGPGEQGVDIFRGDTLFKQGKALPLQEALKVFPDAHGRRGIFFNPKPSPSLDKQFGGIALKPVLDAEFHKAAASFSDAPEDFFQYSVLVVLGEKLEAMTEQALWVGVSGLGQLRFPILQKLNSQAFQLALRGNPAQSQNFLKQLGLAH